MEKSDMMTLKLLRVDLLESDASGHAWKIWSIDACMFVEKIVHCFHLIVW